MLESWEEGLLELDSKLNHFATQKQVRFVISIISRIFFNKCNYEYCRRQNTERFAEKYLLPFSIRKWKIFNLIRYNTISGFYMIQRFSRHLNNNHKTQEETTLVSQTRNQGGAILQNK